MAQIIYRNFQLTSTIFIIGGSFAALMIIHEPIQRKVREYKYIRGTPEISKIRMNLCFGSTILEFCRRFIRPPSRSEPVSTGVKPISS
ncbi:MAG: hypothetical protein M3044_14270, partial [Thermoproteota archaeon]|nr:hypothetical protein [Thermoproteota archaeon]